MNSFSILRRPLRLASLAEKPLLIGNVGELAHHRSRLPPLLSPRRRRNYIKCSLTPAVSQALQVCIEKAYDAAQAAFWKGERSEDVYWFCFVKTMSSDREMVLG